MTQTAGVGILKNIPPAFPRADATAFLIAYDIDNFNTTPGYGFLQYADAGGGNNVMIIGAGASGDDIYGTLFVSPAGISVSGGQALLGSGNGGRGASLGAGNGDGGGDGGAVNIYSGSNGASGNQTGDIFMSTATADFLSNGNTGQMNLSTGTAAGTGLSGSININTGYSNTFSGSINISTSNADTLTGTAGNISLNSGDAFTGGNIQLFGGDSADPFSSNGNIGFYAGTNTSSTIASANILISGSFQDNGGDINLNSSSSVGLNPASISLVGTNTSAMQAASVNINAGANTSFGGGNGGTVNINGGNAFLGNAGAININTGSTFSGTAGDFNLQTGIVSAGGGSGNMSLFTGSGQIGSGNILIGTGTATSVGNAGSIALSTGNGGPAGAGAGGSMQFSTGSGSIGSNDSAGSIFFTTGSADLFGSGGNVSFDLGNSLDSNAGGFSVTGGDAFGSGTGGLISLIAGGGILGGNVQITGGQSNDVVGLSGNIFLNPGSNVASALTPGYFQMYGVNASSGGDVNLSSASYTNSSSATISLNGTNSSFEQSANINLNGAANFSAVFGTAGSINLYGGQANSGQGGNIQITSGGASSGNAGSISLTTGSVAAVGGTSGNVNVSTGSSDGTTGSIQFGTGTPTGNASAGNISFISGSGGVTGGFGGSITFTGGNGSAATNDGGGSLFFNSGSASNAGQAGDVTFQLGATLNGTGGTFNATGGAATGTGQGGDVFLLAGASTAGVGGTVVISTGNGGPAEGDMFFQIAGTTVIRVHQNRNIDLNGMVSSVNPSTQYLCLDATGRMIAQAGVCNVSSGKYKSDVQNLELGLAELMNLRPVSFTFDPTGASSFGFIAEEVAEVDSRLAFSRNGEIEGVNYELISALLTNAIQEQQTIIANIENEISTLNTIPQTENPDVDMINFTLADLRSQLDQFKLDYEEFKTQILNDVEYPGLEEIDVQNEETEQEIVAVSEFLSANFTGIVNFRDEVIFAANNLGAVTLLAQTSEVAVIFSKPLSSTPIVNVTLTRGADLGNYYVDEVNQFVLQFNFYY